MPKLKKWTAKEIKLSQKTWNALVHACAAKFITTHTHVKMNPTSFSIYTFASNPKTYFIVEWKANLESKRGVIFQSECCKHLNRSSCGKSNPRSSERDLQWACKGWRCSCRTEQPSARERRRWWSTSNQGTWHPWRRSRGFAPNLIKQNIIEKDEFLQLQKRISIEFSA